MATRHGIGGRGPAAAIAISSGVATAVVLLRWLRTRTGQRRYREFLARMEQTAAAARQRAREAHQLIQDRTDDLAAAVRTAAEDAHVTLHRTGP